MRVRVLEITQTEDHQQLPGVKYLRFFCSSVLRYLCQQAFPDCISKMNWAVLRNFYPLRCRDLVPSLRVTGLGSWKRPLKSMYWLSLGDNQSDCEHVLTCLQVTTNKCLAGSLCTLCRLPFCSHMTTIIIYSYKNVKPCNIIMNTL